MTFSHDSRAGQAAAIFCTALSVSTPAGQPAHARRARIGFRLGENDSGMALNSDRDHVIATLRAHERELKNAGISRLRLFGSVARGETGNDVDLVAEFDRALSLIDLIGLENRLSDLLGRPVDLAQERMLKPRVRANVDREALLAF
jgi:uncharacterized protein